MTTSYYTSANPLNIDSTAPTIGDITLVPSLTNDNTPNYVFNSSEPGTISYSGGCTSTMTTATV